MSDVPTQSPVSGDLPIRMLGDRLLVAPEKQGSERHSGSGIVIPATVRLGHRLTWGTVVALGSAVHQVGLGDRVLFDPESRAEVELDGTSYVLLHEEDLHAVSTGRRADPGAGGLYL
ncbi:GroES family chaperonin [Acidipropionibacterium virtanenii]|uniref:10 kDa chaperonin n=1 Tax=Acidipropionibacterium virtanenii TaxID=2057246 RepID=A0A344USR1_9ACTN|nr:co-chaperone GroES [Acidipropionibacterium virtanenii]AXE38309.1 10 kDa chaperonin [Acidipropionibacterium virtanenii]